MVKAGESQTIVHEATLDASVVEEPFVKEGQGSAFESRPHVLVLLRTTERGLGLLRRKVEQLINRGFHHVAVDLSGIDKLSGPDEAWLGVRQAAQYAEQWTAWLPIASAAPGVKSALEAAAARDGKLRATYLGSREAVVAAFREREQEESGEEPQPLEVGSSDLTTSSEDGAADPNDWGWGSQDTTAEEEAGPKLDVAELLVQADELPGLRDRVEQIVRKGKKYLTLRLHFKRDRRMADGDLATLVAVRDRMTKAGGQLVLASLQEDVLKWLKLLDEDRHFVITDSADAAEKAHARHASGEAPPVAAKPAGPPLSVVESKVDAASGKGTITVRSQKGGKSERVPVRVVVLGKEGLPHLGTRVKRLAGEKLRDVVADMGRFKDIRGERFDAIPASLEQAKKAGVRVAFANVSREVKALLKILGVVEGGQDAASVLGESLDAAALHLALQRHAASPVGELVFEVTREELVAAPPAEPISSVELEEEPIAAPAPRAAAPATAAPGASSAELQAARAEAQRLQAELAAAKKRADDAARERDALKAKAPDQEAATKRLVDAQKKADEAAAKAAQAQAAENTARAAEAAAKAEAMKLKERLAQAEAAQKAAEQAKAAAEAAKTAEAARTTAAAAASGQLDAKAREAEAKLADLQKQKEAAAAKAAELEKRLAEKEQALAATASQQSDQKAKTLKLEQAVLEKDKRLGGLEADAKKTAERIRTLEAELQAAKAKAGGGGKDAGALEKRVAELEHEKAMILTEAEQEIARLTKEQQLLKEELDSAGEMIERLGKELEFS